MASGVAVLAFRPRACRPSTPIWTVLTQSVQPFGTSTLNSIFLQLGVSRNLSPSQSFVARLFQQGLGPSRSNLLHLPYFFSTSGLSQEANALPSPDGYR